MTRKELEKKAFDIVREDMAFMGTTDEEIMQEIAEASDSDLLKFIENE